MANCHAHEGGLVGDVEPVSILVWTLELYSKDALPVCTKEIVVHDCFAFVCCLNSLKRWWNSNVLNAIYLILKSSISLLLRCIGFAHHVGALQSFLEKQPFASEIKYITLEDSSITGNFEVLIVETGELIHSRQQLLSSCCVDNDGDCNGCDCSDGVCATLPEKQAVAVRIQKALLEIKTNLWLKMKMNNV